MNEGFIGVWAIGWVVEYLPEMTGSCDKEDKASKWVSVAALCIQMGASRKLRLIWSLTPVSCVILDTQLRSEPCVLEEGDDLGSNTWINS